MSGCVVADLTVCFRSVRRRHEDLVDDVNDPVGGRDVREGDIGVVDHDPFTNGEGQVVTIERCRRHAVCEGRGVHRAGHHVVGQYVCERFLTVLCVKRGEVDSSRGKGRVGRCEDRERTSPLQGCHQVSLG